MLRLVLRLVGIACFRDGELYRMRISQGVIIHSDRNV